MRAMSSVDFPPQHGNEFLAGHLLVAMPGIGDPRFQSAVILVCLHTPQHAMGIRLNAAYEGMTLAAILARLGVEGAPRHPEQLVLAGGPVERERGYVLHSDDFEIAGSTMPICEGLSLTATQDVLKAMTDQAAGPARSSLALGYAGWGPGQLESELRDNVWLACPPDPDLVFDEDLDSKWRKALGKMGVSAAALSPHAGRA
jgi:putative transcriptional regulator